MSTKSTSKVELAKRYASALFEEALEKDAVESAAGELREVLRLSEESPELKTLMTSRIIRRQERVDAILAVAEKAGLSGPVRNFLGVLAENGRLYAFDAIAAEYDRLYEEHMGILPVSVVAAQELDETLSGRLRDVLGGIFGRQIRLNVSVDPRLIGGMTIRVGSRMVDSSIKSKLQKLNLIMKGAGL